MPSQIAYIFEPTSRARFQWLEYVLNCVCKSDDEDLLRGFNGAPHVWHNELQAEMIAHDIPCLRDNGGPLSVWERCNAAGPIYTNSSYAGGISNIIWSLYYGFPVAAHLPLDKYGRRPAITLFTNDYAMPWRLLEENTNWEKIEACLDWKDREALAVVRGTVKPLPWRNDPDFPAIPGHWAHVAANERGRVRYTESIAKGARGVHTNIRPGRYLAKYYPHISEKRRNEYAASITSSGVVLFAKTAEEIKDVYLNGPKSCMAHGVSHYNTRGTHPTAVYGDSDVCIAYYMEGLRVAARCVCWQAKQIYGRIYGVDGEENTLINLLRDAGYKRGELHGARVRQIRIDDGRVVMPYIDDLNEAHILEGDSEWIVLGSAEYRVKIDHQFEVQSQDGVGYLEGQACCDNCGEHEELNNYENHGDLCESCAEGLFQCERYGGWHSGDHYNVITAFHSHESSSEPRARRRQIWCEDAMNDDAFMCEHIEEYVSNDVSEPMEVMRISNYRLRDGKTLANIDALNQFDSETWCQQAVELQATLASDGETYVYTPHVATWERISREVDAELDRLQVSTGDAARVIAETGE